MSRAPQPLLLLVLAALCSLVWSADRVPPAAQVQDELRRSLVQGDPAAKIEKVLRAKSLTFTYDRLGSRYQGIIRGERNFDRAVVVYVNVDGKKSYVSLEAHDSYTGL